MSRKPRKAGRDPGRRASEAAEACARRISSKKEREYFRRALEDLVKNNAIPAELLDSVPVRAGSAGKSRFDQLYDAAAFLAFPGYREETLGRLLGPGAGEGGDTKIWRAMFPPRFGLAHVLIRAPDFRTAFALGCDYACRLSLRMFRRIPTDLTVRIQFVSEKAVRRMLGLRWANRVKRRKQLQLIGREFTPKEIAGARLVALGRPGTEEHSVFRYAEKRDLNKVLRGHGTVRVSAVETETFRKDRE